MKSFLLLLVLLLTSCASYKGPLEYELKKNLFYSDSQSTRQQADIYIPEGSGPFPGVILVHGGGWTGRDRSDMESIARSLASNGFVVMNINYRLAPEFKHPAPIEDLESALKYIKANETDFKLTKERIGLWGYSSGGHTASFYALTRANNPELSVKAVVSGGAPYDLTWYPFSPYIKKYLGDFRDQLLFEYKNASASSWVTEKAPPFFLYHGKTDKLVEFAQSASFEAQLKLAGVSASLLPISFWGHETTFALLDEPVEQGVKFLKEKL